MTTPTHSKLLKKKGVGKIKLNVAFDITAGNMFFKDVILKNLETIFNDCKLYEHYHGKTKVKVTLTGAINKVI